ncbi:hypothetical protein H1C71_027072, partial [Ictidomys tridecemlineatus]
ASLCKSRLFIPTEQESPWSSSPRPDVSSLLGLSLSESCAQAPAGSVKEEIAVVSICPPGPLALGEPSLHVPESRPSRGVQAADWPRPCRELGRGTEPPTHRSTFCRSQCRPLSTG